MSLGAVLCVLRVHTGQQRAPPSYTSSSTTARLALTATSPSDGAR